MRLFVSEAHELAVLDNSDLVQVSVVQRDLAVHHTVEAALTAELVQRQDLDDLVLPWRDDDGLVTGLDGVRSVASGFTHCECVFVCMRVSVAVCY